MKFITGLSVLGAFGALSSLAAPAGAQTICQPGGPCPYVELSGGKTTCADAIAMISSFPNGPRADMKYVEYLITNPATNAALSGTNALGANFNVDLIQSSTASNVFQITEASTPEEPDGISQITDLPGYEVAIVERNNSAIAYYTTNIQSGYFAGPTTQTPSKIRICWAIGPCGLDSQSDVNGVAALYNGGLPAGDPSIVEDIQGHRGTHFGEGTNPINVCSLLPNIRARFCNTSVAPGSVGSCVPEDFAGSATTSVITSGIASTRFYSNGTGDSSVSSGDTTTSDPSTCTINPFTGLCL